MSEHERILPSPPVARVDMVREIHYGVTVEDPYRWMEDWKGPELQEWVAAQGAYSRAYLEALPDCQALFARITELSDAGPTISSLQMAGGRAFYLRRDPGENVAKLVVRTSRDAQEQVLFDPNTLGGEAHTAIDWYAPSLDGQQVAYGISQGGSEESTLHVLEVDSGHMLDLAISRVRFGGVTWLEDNQSFLYHRFPELPADAPETEKYNDSRMYVHRLGDDPERDLAVFGRGVNPGVEIGAEDFPFLVISPTSSWMIGQIYHGVLNELTLYATPRSNLSDPTGCIWTRVADVADGVTGYDVSGDRIFLKTHRNAPRFQVTVTRLDQPDPTNAAVVVPASKAVVETVLVAGEYLLIRDLDGGIGRLRRVKLSGGEPEAVPLPFEGSITEMANEPGGAEVLMQMTSWTVSPRIYRYDATAGTLSDTGWRSPSPVNFGEVEVHEVYAPAKDGTLIPLSIIHRKGLKRDGNNPTLLMGYGSYGITMDPAFQPTMLAWYERGGVYAVAHIRGGGEYGEEWHKAGQKLNKGNTIDDFITCAEYLIGQGYARPERLAGEGTSAGGIPSGGALVKRPDLWAVMVMRVAVTNALRSEVSENGPPNVPEFGSVTTEEGFRALQIVDSYLKVQDGVPYPAVLLTTGLNDPRVVIWEATKMAARLQAATSSGKPILMRVEKQGGHGVGSTKRQNDEELAEKLAFLLQQFGMAGIA